MAQTATSSITILDLRREWPPLVSDRYTHIPEKEWTTHEEGQESTEAVIAIQRARLTPKLPGIMHVGQPLYIREGVRYGAMTDGELLVGYRRLRLGPWFWERHVLKLPEYIRGTDGECEKLGHRLFGTTRNSLAVVRVIVGGWTDVCQRVMKDTILMICFVYFCYANDWIFERVTCNKALPRWLYVTQSLLDIRNKFDASIDHEKRPWRDYPTEAKESKFAEFVFRVMEFVGLPNGSSLCDDNISKVCTTLMTSRNFSQMHIANLHTFYGLSEPLEQMVEAEKFKRLKLYGWLKPDKKPIHNMDSKAVIPEVWAHYWLNPVEALFTSELTAAEMATVPPSDPRAVRVMHQLLRFMPKSTHDYLSRQLAETKSVDLSFPTTAEAAAKPDRLHVAMSDPALLYTMRLGIWQDMGRCQTRERLIGVLPLAPPPRLRYSHFGPMHMTAADLVLMWYEHPPTVLRVGIPLDGGNELNSTELGEYRVVATLRTVGKGMAELQWRDAKDMGRSPRDPPLSLHHQRLLRRLHEQHSKMSLEELFEAYSVVGRHESSVFRTLFEVWHARSFRGATSSTSNGSVPSAAAMVKALVSRPRKLAGGFLWPVSDGATIEQRTPGWTAPERACLHALEYFLRDWRTALAKGRDAVEKSMADLSDALRRFDKKAANKLAQLLRTQFGSGWNGHDSIDQVAELLVRKWLDEDLIMKMIQQDGVAYRKDEHGQWAAMSVSGLVTGGMCRQLALYILNHLNRPFLPAGSNNSLLVELTDDFLENCNEFRTKTPGDPVMDLPTFCALFATRLYDKWLEPVMTMVATFCPRPGPRFASGEYWKPSPAWMDKKYKQMRATQAAMKKQLSDPGTLDDIVRGEFWKDARPGTRLGGLFMAADQLWMQQPTEEREHLLACLQQTVASLAPNVPLLSYGTNALTAPLGIGSSEQKILAAPSMTRTRMPLPLPLLMPPAAADEGKMDVVVAKRELNRADDSLTAMNKPPTSKRTNAREKKVRR